MLADPAVWIRELRASHQRRADLVVRLGPEELRRPSYDVGTGDPELWIAIVLGEEPQVLPGEPGEPRLLIPAEAFLRLVYGRLDPDHTPAGVEVWPPLDLDDLRALFPGL